MKSNRKTLVLLALFFGGLLTMWGLERVGVRTQWEETQRADRVLPDLLNIPAAEIRRISIDRGDEHFVFARRERGRWQMIEPLDVAAEPARVEALVRNLQDLRRSADAGTIHAPAESFGLAPPAATIRLFKMDHGSSSSDPPLATLEVGKTFGGQRYVRPAGGDGIEVVNGRLIREVDLPRAEWRDPVVMGVPTFQVESVVINRRNKSGTTELQVKAERSPDGRWKLVSPVEAPANGPKVESLLAGISSLRAMDIPKGFVADNVKDFKPYGLDTPGISVELMTHGDASPHILDFGNPVPDEPERVYVRQRDQDDVIIVSSRALSEFPSSPTSLRSQDVASLVPAAVKGIEIQTRTDLFKLTRTLTGWELGSPRQEKADAVAVQTLLSQVAGLQTSEFLEPELVPDPQLDPPVMTIRINQLAPIRTRTSASEAEEALIPVLQLELGRHDVAKKTLFGRLKGDRTLLALPDTFMDVLPKNPYAFRDRSVLSVDPASIKRLTIRHGVHTLELEPDKSSGPNRWRMRRPVEAPADVATVTETLTALSGLRAEDFTAVPVAEGRAFGLEQPGIEVEWESDGVHRLKIGAPVPRSLNYFASLDGQPLIFLIASATARLFDAEFHDHRVVSFQANRAQRVVLRWPNRAVRLTHRAPKERGQVEWIPEPGSEAEGIDLSRISSLVTTMSQLQTNRFIQYGGELPIAAGLNHPRLRVEVWLGGKEPNHVLRIGVPTDDGNVCGAVGEGDSGPAFLLPAPPWNELIQSGERYAPIPDNPFAPPTQSP